MKKNNSNNIMCLDIFLMYEENEEYKNFIPTPDPSRLTPHPLMSWDISGKSPCSAIDFWGIKDDLNNLKEYSRRFNWVCDVPKLLTLQYQAIILTDFDQEICWVNEGFTEMTGYPAVEAIGKTPRFLQGKKTSSTATRGISKSLGSYKPFTKRVLNYRKNQEEYICQLTIFPLLDKSENITHFLALEVEVEK